MMRSKVINEMTISQQKITINNPAVLTTQKSSLTNHGIMRITDSPMKK